MGSRWVRSPRESLALREDGVGVALTQGAWFVARESRPAERLRTPGLSAYLDRAIEEVDETHSPEAWARSKGVWESGLWRARPTGDGWGLFRLLDGKETAATRKEFASSDRARAWAETRFDRGGAGLRGPKPRTGVRATSKLPDVRVTEEERVFAEAVLEKVGLSYSAFVRAALVWANEHVGEDWLART